SRTIGQLSPIEFLLVIALGSAVGDAMFYPEVPLLHAMLVITIVVVANKGLDLLVATSKSAERVLDGRPEQLIANGVISDRFIASKSLGQSELFQQLRRQGVEHLGQVYAAFIEPDGAISVFRRHADAPPGLPIVPPWGVTRPPEIAAGETVTAAARLACMNCGTVTPVDAGDPVTRCPNCNHRHWTFARTGRDVEAA